MADGHTCTTATDPDNFKGGGWVETRNLTSNFYGFCIIGIRNVKMIIQVALVKGRNEFTGIWIRHHNIAYGHTYVLVLEALIQIILKELAG